MGHNPKLAIPVQAVVGETATLSGSETPTHTPTPTDTLTPTSTGTVVPTEPTPEPLQHAWYLYDGDGTMVKGMVNSTTTYYPGRHFNKEVNGEIEKAQKFYFVGMMTITVRTVVGETDTLLWILSDHLSSASVTANEDGTWNSSIQYTAFGEIRASCGLTAMQCPKGTKYRYTGQLAQDVLGLDFYVARWYDPLTSHFVSADTIVPNPRNSQSFNRYSYVNNNPIRYNDPCGHRPAGRCEDGGDCEDTWWERAEAIKNADYPNRNEKIKTSDKLKSVDRLFWRNVPSAIGFHFGLTGQTGAFLEWGVTPLEGLLLFNLRSSEVSLFYSKEFYGYLGTPTGFEGGAYFGKTKIYGLTENKNLEGPSEYLGLSANFDSGAKGGLLFAHGKAVDPNGTPNGLISATFIDPGSGLPITYEQSSLFLSASAIPNLFDFGISAGRSESIMVKNY